MSQPSPARRAALAVAGLAAFGVYVAAATLATLIFPLALPIFLAPGVLALAMFAPQGRAAPKALVTPLVYASAFLMPLWPVYLHLALGPMPILTPARVIFYLLTVIWLFDMAVSPLRRGQFFCAIRRRPVLAGLVFAFFALNALSVPLAEGTRFAAQSFFRQTIILLLPFCVYMTYIRRWREFRRVLALMVIGAAIAGAIALGEVASKTLLATRLAPFIMADGVWLDVAQTAKMRDGVFRAQATHTHPLSLGEFLCFSAPLAFAFLVSARGAWRWVFGFLIILIVAGVVATNSRGAMLALAPGMGLVIAYGAFRLLRDPQREIFRPVVGLACAGLIAVSPVIAVGAHAVITGESGASAARSSQSRIEQVKMAWPKIVKRPVLGYGSGRAAPVVGYVGRRLTLDNYYLTTAVDVGLPGPIVFFLIMLVALRRSLKDADGCPPAMRWLLVAFAGAMAAFMLSRLVNSQTANLNFFFPMIGALIGASAASVRTPRPR